MKILVTGGPVHAYLDAVKIITNRFKGGLMTQLAGHLATVGTEVTLLRNKGNEETPPVSGGSVQSIYHDGFQDYREIVNKNACSFDAIVLGAAVANLIPANPLKGKFPSHNFKPGDIIPIDFTIAPRVIGEVKENMKRGAHLFGFKLLSGVPLDELVSAAYDIVLESKATAVFANNAKDLQTIHAVTKERGVHTFDRDKLAAWIHARIAEQYYTTRMSVPEWRSENGAKRRFYQILERFQDKFPKVQGDYIFGSIAFMRENKKGFWTTARGKNEMDGDLVWVMDVNPDTKTVYVSHPTARKASLNAPLLHRIFMTVPNVEAIVHYHEQYPGIKTQYYATPGTVEDTNRIFDGSSFNIAGHGCYLLLNKNGDIIV